MNKLNFYYLHKTSFFCNSPRIFRFIIFRLWSFQDIAILTNDLSRCPMYLAESQNVKEKYACKVDQTYLYQVSQNTPCFLWQRFIVYGMVK